MGLPQPMVCERRTNTSKFLVNLCYHAYQSVSFNSILQIQHLCVIYFILCTRESDVFGYNNRAGQDEIIPQIRLFNLEVKIVLYQCYP